MTNEEILETLELMLKQDYTHNDKLNTIQKRIALRKAIDCIKKELQHGSN